MKFSKYKNVYSLIYPMAAVYYRFSAGEEGYGVFNRNPTRGCRDLLRSGDSCRCSPTMEQKAKALETQVAKLSPCYLFVCNQKPSWVTGQTYTVVYFLLSFSKPTLYLQHLLLTKIYLINQ